MEDIFIKNLPFIDLHGYDIESARVATNDFINDNSCQYLDVLLYNHHLVHQYNTLILLFF